MMDNMTMMYIPDLAAQNGEGGSYVYGYGLTLAKAVELWQLGVRGELSPKTVVWYAGMLKHLLIYYGPETQVEALTLDDLRRYRAYLLDERKNQRTGNPLSVNTVDAHVRAIKGFFSWLQKDGKIKKNPSQRLKRPDLPKRGRRGVSDADAEKMFAAAMPLMDEAERAEAAQMLRVYLSAGRQLVGHGAARQKLLVMVGKVRAVAMLSVLASTACRLGGFCGLQVHDLELDGSQALIHEKGNKERPVFLLPEAVAALRDWLAVRPANTGVTAVWTGLQWPRYWGTALGPDGVASHLTRLKKAAGVTGKVNAHQWRHMTLRRLTQAGMPLGMVADIAGHSDVRTTRDFYGSFETDELHRAFDRYSSLPVVANRDLKMEDGRLLGGILEKEGDG